MIVNSSRWFRIYVKCAWAWFAEVELLGTDNSRRSPDFITWRSNLIIKKSLTGIGALLTTVNTIAAITKI
jgi:hypothetical protein